LENDLLSCILVNRLWCEVSVGILWKSIWNYKTLIACFPNESKEILLKNEINIPIPTSKPPLFNYMAFIKCLIIDEINEKIGNLLKSHQTITSRSLNYNIYLVTHEMFKNFMKKISLKELKFYSTSNSIPNFTFTTYPGAIECLKNLSEFSCNSDIYSEFFYQISQTCRNLQSLNIKLESVVSNGLPDLISVQQDLKSLRIFQSFECKEECLTDFISSITKLPNTLVKLNLYADDNYFPYSFVTKFTNLRVLVLKFDERDDFRDFEKLQYVTFPQLHLLEFSNKIPKQSNFWKIMERI